MAVAVVIDEGAAGVPALQTAGGAGGDAGFAGDIGKGAVAIVVIESAVAPVGDEEIVMAVIVVIADAYALSPAGAAQTGGGSDVGKRAVAIVLIEAVGGLLALDRFGFEAGAVDQEDIEPAVVIEIEEGGAAAGGFEQKAILLFAAEDGLRAQAGFARHVNELCAERQAVYELIESEDTERAAERVDELTPRERLLHGRCCRTRSRFLRAASLRGSS